MCYYYQHSPVLLHESIEALNIRPNGIYLDCTFGMGGHSKHILSKLYKGGKLLSFDCDPETYVYSKAICDNRFYYIHSSFSNIYNYLLAFNLIGNVDGIIIDLGISSHQLSNSERGFSFYNDGPLDMRMDNTRGKPLFDWLVSAKEYEVNSILKSFGDEKHSIYISKNIKAYIEKNRITRTKELSKAISTVNSWHNNKTHPATCSFQAFRVYINNELEEIKTILTISLAALSKHGRLVVLSYNSIEDKLVKAFIYNNIHKCILKSFSKIKPSKQEANYNYSSRSAVLRFAEKI
ncbi:16S rRNA (cytosine(1402)-N(4))-methyltransferase RsmH [Candidatus Tremblaya phenacola]|uniref:Ribosomal RNA small subunit methyltransferase H n=1 Tax=Candidatus Tremblayella phenacoccinincola TaxID=1010676 RepID=A0A2G0V791_9PROT|nr:16S rRNA (cytosine(1402)-N(4))-methyltransferase RsmH [Candidatus Tremblaya phenacola]PHN16341.1 Ribosomal RNA small subunit methyltransferase H [Candidatus Tremblaya phenacola]